MFFWIFSHKLVGMGREGLLVGILCKGMMCFLIMRMGGLGLRNRVVIMEMLLLGINHSF